MVFVKINKSSLAELAEKFFLQGSGINKAGRKYERMRKDAFEMRKVAEERVNIRAAYRYFDEFELNDRKLTVGGTVLECNAFERLERKTIKGVYVYALSVGDFDFSDRIIMEQLYADFWGSAFTDAARLILKQKLEENGKLSDSFGPGFYGMKVEEMGKFAGLLEMDEIGIEIRNKRIMLPLKSCVGVYFDVTEKYEKLHDACSNCYGNERGCKLCNIYGGIN